MENTAEDLFTTAGLDQFGLKHSDPVKLAKVRDKLKVSNEFVMLFVENFQRLVPILTKTELSVTLSLLKFLNYQNVFAVTQRSIAADTGLTPAAVSRAFKRLKELNIVAETKTGVGYINPYIFAKGNILQLKKDVGQMALCFDGHLETEQIKKPF